MLHLFEVIQNTRDLSLLAAALYLIMTLGPLANAAKVFFARATTFMDSTENTLVSIRSNHLSHIQESLEKLVQHSEK